MALQMVSVVFQFADDQNNNVKRLFQMQKSHKTFTKCCYVWNRIYYCQTFVAEFNQRTFTTYFKQNGQLMKFNVKTITQNGIVLATDHEARSTTHAETVEFLQRIYMPTFVTMEEREYLSYWTVLLFHIQRRVFCRNGRVLFQSVIKHYIWKKFKAYGPLTSQADIYFLMTKVSNLFVVVDKNEATQYSVLFETLRDQYHDTKDLRPADVYAILLGLFTLLFEKKNQFTVAKKNCMLSSILKAYGKQHPHTKYISDVNSSLLRESHPTRELVPNVCNQNIGNKLKATLLWFLHLHYQNNKNQ